MIQDINGNEITIGSYVRYINTGTKGHVVNIKIDGDDVWVVLDNDLMYRPNLLEVLDEKKEEKKEEFDKDKLVKKQIEERKIEIPSDVDLCGGG